VLLCLSASAPASADPVSIGWAQPGGAGSPVDVTYSYANLLDSGFNTTLGSAELRRATELALGVWARYVPLHFVEVPDSGPVPSDREYGGGFPDIRLGYQPRLNQGSAALAYFPNERAGWEAAGLAGDIHFSNDLSAFHASTWGHALDGATALDFFSVALHEIGHALGVPHIFDEPAIMSGSLVTVFSRSENADLQPADITAIRALYGSGTGSVEALTTPEPGTIVLLATGLGLGVQRIRRRRVPTA
jgi:hypothetical protein